MTSGQMIVLLILASPAALAEPANDPWGQVPALPTSCYTEDDGFQEEANAAIEALESDRTRQEETNDAIAQQFVDIDIMEQQQRMVDFMMEHPAEAQRYMENLQQGGQQVQEQTPQMTERQLQLDAELQDLSSRYDAALRQATASIDEQRQKLPSSAESCTRESMAKAAALSGEENTAYDSLCAGWWKPGGAFHGWFAEFRQLQIELAAQQDEQADTAKLNYEVMGIAADQYRSTGYLRAPIEYLRRAGAVFSKRRFSPMSEAVGECGDGHG